MTLSLGMALCVAYSAGLLLSYAAGFLTLESLSVPWSGIIGGCFIPLFVAIAPPNLKLGLRIRQGCWLGCIFLLATLHITLRAPTAGTQDISQFVDRVQAIAPTQIITGRLIDEPSLNRDLKGRFTVAVDKLQILDERDELTFEIPVGGHLYITAPLLQVTGLHRGEWIQARGRLYLPSPALNPNGFDFQAYLARQGTFAGFVADKLDFRPQHRWGLWRIRQRIVRTHVRALGSPLGQLVSAIALGRKAVDLPRDIQELFSRVGLAHTIAASGFHVSLLLGTVLALLRSRSDKTQAVVGVAVLIVYLTLTGLQPSVVRAALMGSAALIGLVSDRKVIPRGALIVAITLMLIANPNWIWNVGFQLSVVATWGLIVTVPVLTKQLDWMPVTVASLIAVPTAATLWTLPLMLYHFNVISGSSILLNIMATPLISVVSLGGIASSAVSLASPTVGGLSAQLLDYPLRALLGLARMFSHLPGSAIAIGQISVWQMIGLYSILFFCLSGVRRQMLRGLLAICFIGLILGPMGWRLLTQYQVTILAAGQELVWVMQDHGQTTVLNSGNDKTAFYTVGPFLKQAGVNQIERAIALPFQPDYLSGWQTLLRQIPAKHWYGSELDVPPLPALIQQVHALQPGQTTALKHLNVQLLGTQNPIVRLTTPQESWLLLPTLSVDLQDHLSGAGSVLQSDVLLWNGDDLSKQLLAIVRPRIAICYGHRLSDSIRLRLQKLNIQTYCTGEDGAITWQPRTGFHSYRATKHRNASPWG